jgi:hypothetical protein
MRTIRSKLTYANVIATLALFIAVGGATAFAATQLKKNSVGTKQIKNNAVTEAKIKNGSVTGAKVKNGSLTGTQVNASTLGTVPSATSATTATNATSLGGSPASAFQQSANLLSAVVTNDGTATLVRGTAGATVERVGPGEVEVTFSRDVSQCTWVADRGEPGPELVANGVATVRGVYQKPNTVEVVTYSVEKPGEVEDMDFHLIVLC